MEVVISDLPRGWFGHTVTAEKIDYFRQTIHCGLKRASQVGTYIRKVCNLTLAVEGPMN